MTRRTVAVVLVLDVTDDDDPATGNANLATLATRAVAAVAPGIRVPYAEVHDDLDAVLDPETADRYTVPQEPHA